MIYLLTGSAGFLIIQFFDLVSLKNLRILKPVSWTTGIGLLLYSLVMIIKESARLPLPPWLAWPGWLLLIVSSFLLVHSLFINLPFAGTYLSRGVNRTLVTSGQYALVRHPGILWLTLSLISLLMVSRSSLLLAAIPVFTGLDILLAAIQDRYVFGRMFPDYGIYRKETPMLIPTRRSISVFLDSFKSEGTRKLVSRRGDGN